MRSDALDLASDSGVGSLPAASVVVAVGAVALLVSLLIPSALLPLLRRGGVLDVPNNRSSHTVVTPRGGGVGVGVAFLLGSALTWLLAPQALGAVGICVVALSVAMWALGAAEDIRGIRALVRLVLQFAIALAFSIAVTLALHAPLWVVIVGAGAVTFYTNAANFMDGVNGISSLHAVLAAGVYAVIGALTDRPALLLIGVGLAAAFGGFLPWNAVRARLFLGDSGSYLLGGSLAGLAVVAAVQGVRIELVLVPLTVYVADVVATLGRRAARGAKITEPHRDHVYQRIVAGGLTHLQSAGVVTLVSLICVGVVAVTPTGPARLVGDLAVIVTILAYFSLPTVVSARSRRAVVGS